MTVRDIRYFGDPVLKSACDPVTRFDKKLRDLVQDLLDTTTPSGRAGVAANQIGVSLRVFSYNVDDELGYVINPEIVDLGAEMEPMEEGCLSVPGLWYPVSRHTSATVKGVDMNNEPITVSGTGTLAQALQHETDHLDGHVYLDRLDRQARGAALKEIRGSDWF
ncbi:peptide deformylase [Spelaeicoccus albus]|uniref:Peptide deformylase n=1 Tax=Spelaeicoccus albus TaxID=1280376 RepID=A0A7Z0D3T7_9MICO|nr:peptide deformylase [Spelaeicoccus albus]NYI68368.1 peptide deformylase [Spelaeicoccus albus]